MKGDRGLRHVVWTSSNPPGVEYCTVRRTGSGWNLKGTVVRRAGRSPAVLTYAIQTDPGWRTEKVAVEETFRGKKKSLMLEVKGSRWFVDGKGDGRFQGCVDVDLQSSPVTNTLPIKRTRLRVGSRVDLTACWVRFPSLNVAPLNQSYERLGRRTYRYRSASGFSSEVEVDAFGLVKQYGEYWLAV